MVATAALLAVVAVTAAGATPTPTPTAGSAAEGDVGGTVGRNVAAAPNGLHTPRAHNSPQLAVDPTDQRFVALAHRSDNPDFSCGLQLSGDGGRSWVAGGAVTALPQGVDHCYAPQVAFDAEGTLYFLFVGLAGQGNSPQGVWLTTSQDRGRSFARPWRVLGPGNYQVRLAIDRQAGQSGRLHLAWLAVRGEPSTGGLPPPPNPIMAAHSDDGGESFSEPVAIAGRQGGRLVAPQLAVGGQGEVHVAYLDLAGDVRDYRGLQGPVWGRPWRLEVASSADGGASYTQPVTVADRVQPPGRVPVIFTMAPPALAADGDGRVYAAWHDARHGSADVFVARSGDRGRSWHGPVAVGDTDPDDGAQRLPAVAIAPDGRVEVAYLDRAAEGHRRHVAHAASVDGAGSFSPPRPLSSEPSDGRAGPRFHLPVAQGHVVVGTGVALHAGGDAALAAWPDTRFAIPGTAQQDLYAARLDRDATTSSWWPIAVAGLGGLGLLGLVAVGWRRRRRLVATAAVLSVVAVTGCDGSGAGDQAMPEAPATVEVAMDEYAFDLNGPVPEGRVTFHVTNHGDQPHDLVLVPLPADAKLQGLLASPTPVAVPPTYVVATRQPGQTATFTVTLQPGRYGLVCFVTDADGIPHHQHGMTAEFRVDD